MVLILDKNFWLSSLKKNWSTAWFKDPKMPILITILIRVHPNQCSKIPTVLCWLRGEVLIWACRCLIFSLGLKKIPTKAATPRHTASPPERMGMWGLVDQNLALHFWTNFRVDFSESTYSTEPKMGLKNSFHQLPFRYIEVKGSCIVKTEDFGSKKIYFFTF